MKKTENINLIKGKFSPAEAKEILVKLINHKINFHQMKNFSLEERFGKPDKRSENRIAQLKKSSERVTAIIESAQKKEYSLRIDSTVKIKLEK
jgi:hypothetical protein